MDWELIAKELDNLAKEGKVFLRTDLPVNNFTCAFPGVLQIYGTKKVITLPLSNLGELNTIACLLNHVLQGELLIITWDIKRLVSYFKYHLPKKIDFKLTGTVVDLMLWESFLGIKKEAPESLQQAARRLMLGWKNEQVKLIHKKIHRPLALEVIPMLETQGVQDTVLKRSVYPFYLIEGQINGRLKCEENFSNCINPHNMNRQGSDVRANLKLRDPEEMFVYFDYQGMEVSVLQYLSKDKRLGQIIAQDTDIYKGIWHAMFDSPCQTDEQRTLIKESFLPIVYGMGAATLSERIRVPHNSATALISGYRSKFAEAFTWVDAHHKFIQDNPTQPGVDFLGRTRYFEEPLAMRNFVVQSPASIVCLEKLVDLYMIAGNKLVFSIHDGYVIRANALSDKPLVSKCKQVLQAPSNFAPGLKLRVETEIGFRLNNLKPLLKKS